MGQSNSTTKENQLSKSVKKSVKKCLKSVKKCKKSVKSVKKCKKVLKNCKKVVVGLTDFPAIFIIYNIYRDVRQFRFKKTKSGQFLEFLINFIISQMACHVFANFIKSWFRY